MPPKYSDQFRNTVEKLRLRLLDLTGRNPSISFRHDARSRKQIRIIDEVPDQLFSRLVSLKDFEIKGIPVPDLEPEDEKTDNFKKHLKRLLKTDDTYLKEKEELGEEPTRKQIKKIEFALRDRLRAVLNMPKVDRETRPSVKSEAEKNDINPSFDLPIYSQNRRHEDTTIQTLKYDDDLEAELSSLFQFSELMESETGTLPLFLAFGFLEWYENESSDKAIYSPLILLPVEIKREKTKDRVRFLLGARDSEPLPNISLIERMSKDFDLIFPSLNDSEDGEFLKPSMYFKEVEKIISRQRDWKIHNWATASIFSFAKMAMYKELEAPSLDAISCESTPLEGMFLSQEKVDESHPFATDYEIESPALKLKVPKIISSADVSQISAVIDVLDGKNLVIEGPPGTGKSQTITNMIAALIEQGKSVLFVAEKRAALTVVKERLAGAKLGPFCLELHSSKAKRKEVVDSLEQRLKVRRDHSAEEAVVDLERQIQSIKTEIGRYLGELNHYHEPLKSSIHDIIWKLLALKEVTSDELTSLQEVEIDNADKITSENLLEISSILRRLGTEYNEHILPFGGVAGHPWYEMLPMKINVPYLDRYFEDLQKSRTILFNIKESLVSIDGNLQQKSIADLKDIVDSIEKLRSFSHHNFNWVVPLLNQFGRDLEGVLLEAEKITIEINSLRTAISQLAPGILKHGSSSELSSFLDMVRKQGYLNKKTSDVVTQITELEISKQNIEATVNTFHNINNLVGAKISLNLENLNKLYELCKLISNCPIQSWETKNENLIFDSFKESALEMVEKGKKLRSVREKLSMRSNLEVCRQNDLAKISLVLAKSNIFSWFNSDYRQIKRVVKTMILLPLDDKGLSQELYRIFSFLKEEKAFAADNRMHQIFNTFNKGIDSDFEGLSAWIKYYESIIRWTHSNGFDHQFAARIINLDKASIFELRKYGISNAPMLPSKNIDSRESLEDKLKNINQKILYLSEIQEISSKFEFGVSFEYQNLENLLTILIQYERNQQKSSQGKMGEFFKSCSNFQDLTERGSIESFLSVYELLDKLLLSHERIKTLLQNGLNDWIFDSKKQASDITKNQNELNELLIKASIEGSGFLKNSIGLCLDRIDRALLNKKKCSGLIEFLETYRELSTFNIDLFIDKAVSKNFLSGKFDKAFEVCFYNSLLNVFYNNYPKLFKSVGTRFDDYRANFRELDDQLIKAYQSRLSTRLCSAPAPDGNGSGRKRDYTEMSLIRHLTTLERPNVSVRDLLSRSSNAVKALKPVFLMSPLSVAQILPPNMKFDVLIMDEASQMRPEDALGSIARCSQIVVVGDPKQMPPSDYFSKSIDESVEDTLAETDHVEIKQESILDLALGSFRTPRRLKWHYRSKSEELIAFSNHYFYENDLVIFPSAKTSPHKQGVYLNKVNGIYSDGLNPIEAKEAVDQAIHLIKSRPTASIMLVAMNQKQSELINDLLSERVNEDPVLEKYIDSWKDTLEPLLVRNLENVQGDERDIVVISTVYGPDSNGHVFQRFGPIGSEYGHRRLNVLYTRAKELMVVVSSLEDSRVEAGPNSSKGVHALKNFLRYARTKQLGAEVTTFGVRPPDSDFEMHVCKKIQEHLPGLEVVAQVGVAGFFIDLAIKHPTKEGAFLIGIECDGKAYHSSKSARDRDKIRQKMLEDLGWKLHRIWSTDWFANPDKEMKRLISKIETLLD